MRVAGALSVIAVAVACGGTPAGGQSAPLGASLARPNMYEIAPEQLQSVEDTGFIEVSGVGSVSVPPDRAAVAFAMETRAPSAAGAASANAGAMDAVLRALRGASLPDLDLETFGYALRPEYSAANNQRTREIVAYTVLNNVRATTSDVDAVGRLIDTAIGAGANRVANIAFMASDTEDAEQEALALAVQNAREQAAVIARTLGYELGPPLEIRGGAQRPRPIAMDMVRAMEIQAAPTPIEASDQTVSASVTVRFALGRELGG